MVSDRLQAVTPEAVRQSVVQPYTMAEIRDSLERDRAFFPRETDWTLDRIGSVLASGIPDTGRLWLEAITAGTTVIDGYTASVKRFEWHLTWMWGERHHPMHAVGHGETEVEAFESLLKALG